MKWTKRTYIPLTSTIHQWLWPIIRRDELSHLLETRYPELDWAERSKIIADLPVVEWRCYGRFNFYDLRVVAKMVPKPVTPSMWRCKGCGKPLFRRWISWQDRKAYGNECSVVCRERVDKKVFKQYQNAERERIKEWQRIKECRRLLKQARSLLRERVQGALQLPPEGSEPVTTSPT